MYRRWIRAGIGIALTGYLLVLLFNVFLFGPGGRPLAVVTQSLTVATLGLALGMAFRGRSGPAAILGLVAIWIELQSGIPVTGPGIPGVIVLPALVSASGMLLGAPWGYRVAGLTTATLAALSTWAAAARPDVAPADTAYWVIVTAATMFAAAALVQLGMGSLASVLRSARASERRLSDVLTQAPDGILATDDAGVVVSANPAAERLFGRPTGTLLGVELGRLLREAGVEGPDRLFPGGGGPGAVRLELPAPGGRVHTVEAEVSPVVWADGTRGHQLMLRDVSERRRAEEERALLRTQLAHAQRLEAVGRLAGGVAHEFNNLLTIVGGAAEMLVSDTEGPTRDLAADILEAKVRGSALTRQLLTFARKDVIQPRRISLTEVARDLETLLGRFLTEQVRLEVDAPHATPEVIADRAQVEQILVNLVMNAKDAVPRTGRVTIGVYPEGTPRAWGEQCWTVPAGFLEMSVTDDGHGMEEKVLERAFEPFFTTKPRGRGTGLGLATVHGTVVQNGGRVRLLSRQGVGSVVIVEWPVFQTGGGA